MVFVVLGVIDRADAALNDRLAAMQARKMSDIHLRPLGRDAELGALQNRVHFGVNRPHTMTVNDVAPLINAMGAAGDRPVVPAGDDALIAHDRRSDGEPRARAAQRKQMALRPIAVGAPGGRQKDFASMMQTSMTYFFPFITVYFVYIKNIMGIIQILRWVLICYK